MRILMLDLLDLAQLENQTFKMNFVDVNLFEVVKQTFAILDHYATLKHISFDTDFDPAQAYLFRRILGDERRFLQILINFVSNAIKFSPAHGRIIVGLRVLEVQVKNESNQQLSDEEEQIDTTKKEQTLFIALELSVRDFGCGMSKENLSKLFIDFNRLEENANLNRNGVGLGLSICKLLIERMAGSVQVESELNEGTTFRISLRTTCKINENFQKSAQSPKRLLEMLSDKSLSSSPSSSSEEPSSPALILDSSEDSKEEAKI